MTQSGRRPLVAGNWKMNGTRASIQVVEAIRDRLSPDLASRIDVLICPPATLIGSCVAAAAGSPIAIGGQNLHARPSGAFSPKCSTSCGSKLAGISGVHTGPGATALTRMPRLINCCDRERVNATIAPFVAE